MRYNQFVQKSITVNVKKGLTTLMLLAGITVIMPADSFSQPPSCDLNLLRTQNSPGWDYLANVTTACGTTNPNNLGGHFLMLHLDPRTESRGIARQISKDQLDRFSIILVTGKTDAFSGEFVPDSMVIEVSNLSNPFAVINDPLERLGGGFFVLKMGLDGKHIDGFRHKTGVNTHLLPLDAALVTDYLKSYWNRYFESTNFIASSEGLAQ